MFGGPWEILIILFIALLLFGKRIPGLMNSLGRSVVEFNKGKKDAETDRPIEDEPAQRVDR